MKKHTLDPRCGPRCAMRLGQQVIELPLRGALASAPAAHVGLDERAAQHERRADRVAEAERLGEEREGGGERARLRVRVTVRVRLGLGLGSRAW